MSTRSLSKSLSAASMVALALSAGLNALGVKGVQKVGGRFRASIRSGGETVYLGTHDTAELAYAAYVEAKRELHEGNTL